MLSRPKLFLGSSGDSDALKIVKALEKKLSDVCEPVAWFRKTQIASKDRISNFAMTFDGCQYACFVCIPKSGSERSWKLTPGVSVEFGYALRALNPSRVFIVCPADNSPEGYYVERYDHVPLGIPLQHAKNNGLKMVADSIRSSIVESQRRIEADWLEMRRQNIEKMLERHCRSLAFPKKPESIGLRAFFFLKKDDHLEIDATFQNYGTYSERVGKTIDLKDASRQDWAIFRAAQAAGFFSYDTTTVDLKRKGRGISNELGFAVAHSVEASDGSVIAVLSYDTSKKDGSTFLKKKTHEKLEVIMRDRCRTISEFLAELRPS